MEAPPLRGKVNKSGIASVAKQSPQLYFITRPVIAPAPQERSEGGEERGTSDEATSWVSGNYLCACLCVLAPLRRNIPAQILTAKCKTCLPKG